jgi:ubiquinone/menaquinone biosynthesis C-methylase UbiE
MSHEKRMLPQPMLPRGLVGRIAAWVMVTGHKSIYKNMSELLDLQPEDDLLEIACGCGHFLKKYASHVHNIAGLDLSQLMVKIATRKNRDRVAAGTAEFVHGEASRLPWQDNKFSVITTMGSFIAFPKPLETLKEMYRVLQPGGRVVVSVEWNAEDGLDHTKEVNRWGMGLWMEDDIRSMMIEAGFVDVSIAYAQGFKMPKMMLAHAMKPDEMSPSKSEPQEKVEDQKLKIVTQIADLSRLLGMIPSDDTIEVHEPTTHNSMALSKWFSVTRSSFLRLSVLISKTLDIQLQ